MDYFSLILYGGVNTLMAMSYFVRKNQCFQFPFWAGAISLGWFYPQAINAYANIKQYPAQSFAPAMFFATLCSLALWIGYHNAVCKQPVRASWLDMEFDGKKLIIGGALLCMGGFFFQWKLSHLPEELLNQTQWSGITVRYYFLGSIFHFGFLSLWLIYLAQKKWVIPRLLIFIVPCLLLLLDTAVVRGRRAGMMTLVSYIFVSLWFVRRVALPRWALLAGLVVGLALINSIGVYRNAMGGKDLPLIERVKAASVATLEVAQDEEEEKPYYEFNNYLYYRKVCADELKFDYGLEHWNNVVFNYVPAQIVGRKFKDSLMLPLYNGYVELAEKRYGHKWFLGTVATGYLDSFKSFAWLGFIKFSLVGWMMAMLPKVCA